MQLPSLLQLVTQSNAPHTTILPLTGPYLIHALASPLTVLESLQSNPQLLSTPYGNNALKTSITHLKNLLTSNESYTCCTQIPRILTTSLTLTKTRFPNTLLKLTPSIFTPATLPLSTATLTELCVCVCTNAVQAYTNSESAIVTISATQTSRLLTLCISDSGKGMSFLQKLRCFQLGYTNKHTGHGIGLATVRKTLSHCGGSVRVISKKGVGTTFTLCIPITSPD